MSNRGARFFGVGVAGLYRKPWKLKHDLAYDSNAKESDGKFQTDREGLVGLVSNINNLLVLAELAEGSKARARRSGEG